MVAEVIGIGPSQLESESFQRNVDFLSRELAALGIDLMFQSAAEGRVRLQQCVASALQRSDLVILVGGLGDEKQDIACDTIAQGLDVPVELHQQSWERIQAWYARRGEQAPAKAMRQAMLPRGAKVFPNGHGTAPGCALSAGRQSILMLPQSPRELMPMFVNHVCTWLAQVTDHTVVIRDFKAVDLIPAEAERRLKDLFASENPVVALYPKRDSITIRVLAHADTRERANALAAPVLREISARLGGHIQGVVAAGAQEPEPEPQRSLWQRLFPNSGDRGLVVAAKSLALLSCLLFLTAGGWFSYDQYQAWRQESQAAGIESLLQTASTQEGMIRPVDYPDDYLEIFIPWWKENPDVAGRLEIEGADFHCPVVQAEDNRYYQSHDFYGKSSSAGTPYVDYRANLQTESENIIIYGSSQRGGGFGELTGYKTLEYYQQHPVIRFDSVYREGEYKVVGAVVADPADETWQGLDYVEGGTAEDFELYIENLRARSLLDTTVDIQAGDRLLTLVTDTSEFSGARLMVVARRLRDGETAQVDVQGAVMNPDPLQPGQALGEAAEAGTSSSASGQAATSRASSTAAASSAASSSAVSSSEASSSAASSKPASSNKQESFSDDDEPWDGSAEGWYDDSFEDEESDDQQEESPEESSQEPSEDSEEESESSDEESNPDEGGGSTGGPIAMGDFVSVNGVEYEAFEAVCSMVMNEMGSTAETEAIKAQAVAIYSRLVARGGSVSGMGMRTPSSRVQQAVQAVWGQTIQSGGTTVDAYFCAASAGTTNTSAEVWGGRLPGHNENVESPWDENTVYYGATTRMSKQNVIERVSNSLGIDLSEIPEEDWFAVNSTTGGGYNASMTVGGQKQTTGRYLRESVLNLKSAAFEWEFDGDYVVFTTYGYGHGVGMSQHGAIGMAQEGSSYIDILEHYYTGCTVE